MIGLNGRPRIQLISSILLLIATAIASACAYPESRVETRDEMAAIMVIGAPEGAVLIVDGIDAGPAVDFSKKRSLAVLPGRHVVVLRLEGRQIAEREVHIGAGTIRTIEFTGLD